MKSTKEFLREIQNPDLSPVERALLRCRLAQHLEEIGNYEAACEAMEEFWGGIGERPKLEALDDERARAEVLLRAGAITGLLGSTRQIEGSQETAKNLITESIGIFAGLRDEKKIAEGQIEIAVCYRRENALDNARVVLSEALSKLDDEDDDLKRLALLRSAVIEKLSKRFKDAFEIFTKAAPLFEAGSNHSLGGRYHNEFAIVLENLGAIENCADYFDSAAMEYTAASLDFEQAGHSRYQACVENNLAMLYLKVNRTAEAHDHLDRAQALFTRLDDTVHLAQVYETRARAWLVEGELAKAEREARLAVAMLEKGDESSLLTDALLTHGTMLSRLKQVEKAKTAFERAVEISKQAGDLESAGLAAIAFVEQMGQQLSDDELRALVQQARQYLKDNPSPPVRDRLLECAFHVLFLLHGIHSDWTNYSFDKAVHRYEEREIRRALEDAGGVISQAARLLGLSHQRLHKKLKGQHKNLRQMVTEILALGQEGNPDPDSDLVITESVSKKSQTIRILHVEDNQTVADAVKETLEIQGWQVDTCADGNTALEKIRSDADYDVLLLDYDLPGVNGLELVRHARELPHRLHTLIVVLSATPVERDAREAGADLFLHKPRGVSLLVESINRLLGEQDHES